MVDIRESNQSVIIPNMETIAKYGRKFKQNKKYKFTHDVMMSLFQDVITSVTSP
jgi:hypothetical protein